MAEPIPTKPYLMRALYEWCVDNGYTPYISVIVDAETRVPMEYVRNGEIVLNIGPLAAHKLKMGNELDRVRRAVRRRAARARDPGLAGGGDLRARERARHVVRDRAQGNRLGGERRSAVKEGAE